MKCILWAVCLFKVYCSSNFMLMGVDNSIFVPCVNTYSNSIITSGNTAGKKIDKEKTILFQYPEESKDKVSEVLSTLYFPQIVATESVSVAGTINKNVSVKDGTHNRTIRIDDLYSDIPEILLLKKYLQKVINKKKKEDVPVLSLGLVTRGYYTENTRDILFQVMKDIFPVPQLYVMTDGMAQAITRIVTTPYSTGYVVAYSLRGEKMVSEVFFYEKAENVSDVSTVKLLHQKEYSGYSDYSVLSMVYNYLLTQVSKIAQAKHPHMNIKVSGTPDLGFIKPERTESEKDTLQGDQETTVYSMEVLPLIDLVLQRIWEMKFTSDKDFEKIENLDVIQTIRTLSLELLPESDNAEGKLILLPTIGKEQIEIDLSLLLEQIVQYTEGVSENIKTMFEETTKVLEDIQKDIEGGAEKEGEEKKEKKDSAHVDTSVYNDILCPQQALYLLHRVGMTGGYAPSKSDLASAPLQMQRMNIKIVDMRPNNASSSTGTYQVDHTLRTFRDYTRPYTLNNEQKQWWHYKKNLDEEVEIRSTLRSLIRNDEQSAEYKSAVNKYGQPRVSALIKQVDEIRNGMPYAKFFQDQKYQEVARAYKKMVVDSAQNSLLDRDISALLKSIPNLVKNAESAISKAQAQVPEPCENLQRFLKQHQVENGKVKSAEKYSPEMELAEKTALKKKLKQIEEGINYRTYVINTEQRQHEEILRQMQEEKKKAEEMAAEKEKEENKEKEEKEEASKTENETKSKESALEESQSKQTAESAIHSDPAEDTESRESTPEHKIPGESVHPLEELPIIKDVL
ncbi:hypothetical protein NEIRO03_1093 [Nematocida sp. AWRm78]|nr:hypothetical protein NEIRO02_1316 [Nematocida sp. AWRm79]KAI5183503.1 hypothetical protein NEIRO03_1093 [Nematocida sp. AWRm78]